jgi:ribose transport system substrate-binding protein
MRFRLTGFVVAAAGAALLLTGCSSTSDSEATAESQPAEVATKLAIISPDYSAQPAAKTAIDEFVKQANAAGIETSVVDTKSDNALVNGEITTAVAQNVDGIVVAFGTPAEFGEGLQSAMDAGVPVFGLDTGGLAEGILVNVTTDNGFLGNASAQAMIDAIGQPGKIAMINFDAFEPVRLRAEAAKKLFEENGFTIIETVQGDPADSTGFASKTVGDWLTKYKQGDIDGVWAGWDASALGAYQATEAAGRTEVVVTGVDGQDFARAEVAKGGNWVATVAQDWPAISTQLLTIIEDYYAGNKPTEQVFFVPGAIITAENAQ